MGVHEAEMIDAANTLKLKRGARPPPLLGRPHYELVSRYRAEVQARKAAVAIDRIVAAGASADAGHETRELAAADAELARLAAFDAKGAYVCRTAESEEARLPIALILDD